MPSSTPPTPNLTGLPLRSAMKAEDDLLRTPPLGANTKAVQIAEPEPDLNDEGQTKKQFSAGLAKRLSGRPPAPGASSSRLSLKSQNSLEALNGFSFNPSPQDATSQEAGASRSHSHSRHRPDRIGERLVAQVAEWLEHEKRKKKSRKTRKVPSHRRKSPPEREEDPGTATPTSNKHQRSFSIDSQSSEVSLDRLQRIIDDGIGALGLNTVPHYSPRLGSRRSSRRRSTQLHRTASSDTDYQDGDVIVPSCDAVLDNTKTLNLSDGLLEGTNDDGASISSRRSKKERAAWAKFKNDIIRIAHTLRIKGWRRVPLESGDAIEVERLSGALTNAVYVVSPPKDLPKPAEAGKKQPGKILLRVYGPQADNIIDRENELGVLRRLARKKIGPRMLGTFENGRFEQFFYAFTLRPKDLRDPDTSKQIAKRMRELHDGIELLEEEKEGGPGVLKNWDNWLDSVSKSVTFLDRQLQTDCVNGTKGLSSQGYVCGVEWLKFKEVFDKYREYVDGYYKTTNIRSLRESLVFAHNDTQYGNILRLKPDDEKSPLMQPQNKHKQLVVIDFEYAAANTQGYEFANHFSEWAYNYHDATAPHACNTANYPKPEEQYRFIKAYVEHRPEFPHGGSTPNLTPLATPSGTPGLSATTPGSTSSIIEFMLDARVPPGGWREEERRREDQLEQRIRDLLDEARLWRVACSAQWLAWGIMQAKIPGFDKETGEATKKEEVVGAGTNGLSTHAPQEEPEGEAEDFDYLAYARERALFFWGDCVLMGLVKLEELPDDLRTQIKLVAY